MKAVLEEMAQPYLIRIIEEDKEAISSKLNEIWSSKKNSVMLDGFRKGKVPQNLAEQKLGFENLYRPYIDELIQDAINKVNNENEVTIMDLQQIVPEKLDKNGIVMQAVAYLKPTVSELDYSKVEVTKLDNEATDEEVSLQLSSLQEQNALVAPVTDRGVEFGDIVVLSYEGSLPDDKGTLVPFEGGKAENQQLTLTQGAFIPGFGEEIIGMKTNEDKVFTVTFPENYGAIVRRKLAPFQRVESH